MIFTRCYLQRKAYELLNIVINIGLMIVAIIALCVKTRH